MILEQHYLTCLAQASYLIADESSKKAVIVDPRRDVELYLEEAKRRGLTIEWVLLTHFHADFLAGHLELREKTGAKIGLGRAAQAEYEFTPFADGEELVLGDEVRLQFLETPGHTPESMCILVFDRKANDEAPHAVLTGDTLFIGDVGRPDLMASVGFTREQLATKMYHSLRDKLLTLPDETVLYPGHGAGSSCGKSLSSATSCTIGNQRASNYALQEMTAEEFVGLVTEGLSQPPKYFSYDAALNKKERGTLGASLEASLHAVSLDEALQAAEQGAQLVDTRTPEDWEREHLRGTVSIGLGGMYASWAGTVLDTEREIVILADPGQEEESILRLGRIGLDRVKGFIEGGMDAVRSRPELLASVARIEAPEFEAARASDNAPWILDVRKPGEWETAHIEGSTNIPLADLEARLAEIPRDREVVLHCQTGYRSAIAASLMQRGGVEGMRDLVGGFEAWAAHAGEASAS